MTPTRCNCGPRSDIVTWRTPNEWVFIAVCQNCGAVASSFSDGGAPIAALHPQLYDIHFRRHHDIPDDFVSCGEGLTADEVMDKRSVSGDLVVYHGTKKIVTDPWWLFTWERDRAIDSPGEPACSYARRAIEWQKTQNERSTPCSGS